MVVAEYEEKYWEYYGEKFGWEEIITREVDLPQGFTEYDANGNETRVYCQGSSYLRSTWRPRQKREGPTQRSARRRSGDVPRPRPKIHLTWLRRDTAKKNGRYRV
jgi:hypothetical protein